MSYKQVLIKAQFAPSLVTIERHGVPNVSGRVLSLDADGATIQTKAEAEVYIETLAGETVRVGGGAGAGEQAPEGIVGVGGDGLAARVGEQPH